MLLSYDFLVDINKEIDFSKVHIFADENPIELRIDSYRDLIPYFPCIPYGVVCNNNEYYIYMSSKPWYRTEEENIIRIQIIDMITCYNRLKKEKNLTLENLLELYKKKYLWKNNCEVIAQRVIETKGKKDKVEYSDIFGSGDYYRKGLYKHMIENGWDEYKAKKWCYGLERITSGNCPV